MNLLASLIRSISHIIISLHNFKIFMLKYWVYEEKDEIFIITTETSKYEMLVVGIAALDT